MTNAAWEFPKIFWEDSDRSSCGMSLIIAWEATVIIHDLGNKKERVHISAHTPSKERR